jgi:hypothetical protein
VHAGHLHLSWQIRKAEQERQKRLDADLKKKQEQEQFEVGQAGGAMLGSLLQQLLQPVHLVHSTTHSGAMSP